MAGRINPDDIALVRERSSIAEVIGEVVTLRNAGSGSLKGLCPFHEEKTPSFHVTPAKGLYYCFSCQAGGDVIGFIQAIDHLTFAEAVEKLAARTGVELRYEASGATPRGQQGQRTRLIELHREAATFYREQLSSSEAVTGRRFLDERGFDEAAAAHFGVGYAPQGWDALTKHLRQRGFTDTELTVSGVAKEGQRGLIDRFRGRLIWPIRDLSGDVVGFGARKL
jgi:DNA primase